MTVLPFNSTEIFPLGWCQNNGLESIKLLKNNNSKALKTSTKEEPEKINSETMNENNSYQPDCHTSISHYYLYFYY